MKSKSILLVLWFTIGSYGLFAVESEIRQVTVYRQGAKITRTAKVNLKSGNQEVLLDNLTSSIDANSLQVNVKGNATLLSASVRKNYVGYKSLPKRLRELKDSLELLTDRINWLNNEQAVYKGEEDLVRANQKIVNEKEKITAADLTQLADFYRKRLLSLREMLYENAIDLRETKEKQERIEQQLRELNYQNGQQMGEIVLNISADQATQVTVQVTYLSYNAGWTPIYDIRCSGIKDPLDLIYKANVYQSTGYDWSGVDLVISTGNPTANNNRPVMSPWYIDFYEPYTGAQWPPQSKAVNRQMLQSNMMIQAEEDFDDAAGFIMADDLEAPVPYDVQTVTNQMTSEYEIKVKQDIPSDGKEHIVAIRNIELPATYSYHSAPKLDQHAFLLARIGEYGKYDLLPGQTNIFFEGMYVGQTALNPGSTGDSLILSLGRDDRINIKRNTLTDFTSVKTIGANKKVEKGFEIIVRNNKNTPVKVEVLDQIPLSNNKDIEVEILQMEDAEFTKEYGRLLWKFNLDPGETRKIEFTYSVKFPKDKQIQGF